MRLRKTVYGRTRSDVELAEWPAIERSASGRSRPVIRSSNSFSRMAKDDRKAAIPRDSHFTQF